MALAQKTNSTTAKRIPRRTGTASPFSFSFAGNKKVADVRYTPELAFQIPEFFACVRALSDSFASLPIDIYERETRAKATDLPLYSLLRYEPNTEQTAFEFQQNLVISLCKWGWAAAVILREKEGTISQIILVDNRYIKPCINKETRETSWEIKLSNGETLIAANSDVLCINLFNEGGLVNAVFSDHLQDFFVNAKRVEVFGGEYFQNAINPAGVISSSTEISPENWQAFKANFSNYIARVESGHNFLVLPFGINYKPFELSDNQKNQFLDTRKFNRSLIQGLLRVPAYLVGDLEKATYTNAETQDIGYSKHTLAPIAENICQRYRKQLLSPDEKEKYYIEANFNALTKGVLKDRADSYSQMVNCGTLTPNEARAKENLPPLSGGDQLFVNSTLIPIGDATKNKTTTT